jgi:hypothetical protein
MGYRLGIMGVALMQQAELAAAINSLTDMLPDPDDDDYQGGPDGRPIIFH